MCFLGFVSSLYIYISCSWFFGFAALLLFTQYSFVSFDKNVYNSIIVVRFFDPQKNDYFKTNPYQFVLKIKAGKRSSLKVGKLMTILNNVPSS